MNLSCIRPYDKQIEILNRIRNSDNENDEEISNIKQTIDFILNVENPISANELKSTNEKKQAECSDQKSKSDEDTELTHILKELNIQKQFMTEKVEEKKKQLLQYEMENKRNEAEFIISLRSIRDHICKQAKSSKSNS